MDALVYGTSIMKGPKMGCDIHWYSETKKDGKWVCDQAESYYIEDEGTADEYHTMDDFPNRGRDYWWFGFIQPGVRSSWDFGFDESHQPDDLSPEVERIINRWDSDGHSHGHLTRAELKAKLVELAETRTRMLINPTEELGALKHLAQRLEKTISNLTSDVPDEDQRIVFFFDN